MSLHRDQMGADYHEGPSLLRTGRKRGYERELERGSATLALVSLLLALLLSGVALGFSDVLVSHPFATAIDDLTARGIINGFDDGTFRPAAPVTRQQFAKMIVGALYLPASTADLCPFPDVVSSKGADLYPDHLVAVAAARGITEGYSDGTFGPYRLITRAHVVTMVVRALKALDPAALRPAPAAAVLPGEWEDLSGEHGDNARIANENGLLEGLDLESASKDPLDAMPRGEVAQVLYNMNELLPEIPAFEWSIEQIDESLKAQMQESGSWKAGVPISL